MQTCLVFTSFLFLTIIIAISLSQVGAAQNECMLPSDSERCGKNGIDIRFPFWIKGRHPEHCGYSRSFAVSCSATDETVLELPFSGLFSVRNINYESQTVDVYDPDGCLPQRLLHLNLSASPFLQVIPQQPNEMTYGLRDSTFFNCSTTEKQERNTVGLGGLISCLSVPGHQVYVFDSSTPLSSLPLRFCEKVGTLSSILPVDWDTGIQSEYYEAQFSLILNWSQPLCGSTCEANGRYCRLIKNRSNSTGPDIECFDPSKSPSPPISGIYYDP